MFKEVFRQQHLLIYSANHALERHSFYFGSTINPFHVTHKISLLERMVSKEYICIRYFGRSVNETSAFSHQLNLLVSCQYEYKLYDTMEIS